MQIVVQTKIGRELQDKVINNARLLSNGFDDNIQKSGRIGMKDDSHPDKFDVPSEVSWKMKIPDTIASSPFFTVKLFEKPLGSILDAIESLIRNPSGCFEQTSSTTYPMIMALQLLNEMQNSLTDDDAIKRVRKMKYDIMEKLKKGYERLLGFETSSQGYEWFGKAPGHEALSAYGIAQFNDLKKVVNFVDDEATARNTAWLMGRKKKDRSGKFQMNPEHVDTFGGATQDITDAYLVWVLTQD
jgi:hypothetical protein